MSGGHNGSALGCKCNEDGSHCEDEVVPVPDIDPRAETIFWKKKARERLARIGVIEDELEDTRQDLDKAVSIGEESVSQSHLLMKRVEGYQEMIVRFLAWMATHPEASMTEAIAVFMGAVESAAKAEGEREGAS